MSMLVDRPSLAAQSGVVVAMIAGLMLTSTLSVDAQKDQKGKPSPPPDAVGTVTFADGPYDKLTSDGGGAYDGATIYGSGTLLLDLSKLPGRRIWIDLDPAAKMATADGDNVAPGLYASDAALRIDTMGTAPATGEWVRSVGRIGFGTSLPNHALGFRYATANGVPIYGTEVCVKRVVGASRTTWLVASSEACTEPYEGQEGQAGLFEGGLKGRGYQFKAVYKVPFLMTVVCTSGSTCPQ